MSNIKPSFEAILNLAHPLAQNIAGCWLFNEGAGKVAYDHSGYERHGDLSIYDPPQYESGWYAGPHGFMLGLNITKNPDDSFDVAASKFNWTPDVFSVVWLTCPTDIAGWEHMLTGTSPLGWGNFTFHSSVTGAVYVGTDVATRIELSAGTVTNNEWQQFAYTLDADNNARFYRNAKLIGGPKAATDSGAWSGFRSGIGVNQLLGYLNYIYIYGRALSADEIAYLYAFPYAMFECFEWKWRGGRNVSPFPSSKREDYPGKYWIKFMGATL